MIYNKISKPVVCFKRIERNTRKFLSCSTYVLDQRYVLIKKSMVQSSICATSDMLVEINLDNHNDFMNFNYIHFIDHYMTTYIFSSLIFFLIDSLEEFDNCSKDECPTED